MGLGNARASVLLLAAFGLGTAACSTLLADDFTGGNATEDGREFSPDAARIPEDASPLSGDNDADAPDAERAELIDNGGFEKAGNACGPSWTALDRSVIQIVSSARTGGQACSVCANGTDTYYGIYHALAPKRAGQFALTAHIRVDGTRESLHGASLYIRKADGELRYAYAQLVASAGPWREMQVFAALATGESLEGFDVYSRGTTPECFTADDVSLVLMP